MKVTKLEAHKVHDYLPIKIDFLPDITFLTGLNGSGKTTALRLLMGLLAPNVDVLVDVSFTTATATVVDNSHEIVLQARRSSDGLILSISDVADTLTITTAEMQLLAESRAREERTTPVHEKVMKSEVYQTIAKMSTPMFLGLDRRLYLDSSSWERSPRLLRHRDLEFRRYREAPLTGTAAAALADVNDLVFASLSEVRARQEQLDAELRNQILLDSFVYETATAETGTKLPNRRALEDFRAKQAAVERAAAGLRLPVGPLQSALSDFFDRMKNVVDAIEKQTEAQRTRRISGKPVGKRSTRGKSSSGGTVEVTNPVLIEWVMNLRQADRIFNQVARFEEYLSNRAKLHERIDRFVALTNSFLSDTNKSVRVTDRGFLAVRLGNDTTSRPVHALSSGERQLVVMLAHLSLNKDLAGSGVFIVDEPELSLHIGWQERFVGAIQEANPNVQLIMATHSPAIIMDRVDHCRTLSRDELSES